MKISKKFLNMAPMTFHMLAAFLGVFKLFFQFDPTMMKITILDHDQNSGTVNQNNATYI